MHAETLIKILENQSASMFIGVPDSLLKPLSDYLIETCGISDRHVIAANEGNAVAIAAGYHLATGQTPVIYMQNSGIGNAVNPIVSLLNNKVYGIPCVFIIGWRGEPGTKDEPQHIYQGEITEGLLEQIGINVVSITPQTKPQELEAELVEHKLLFSSGKSVALLVKKGALEYEANRPEEHNVGMLREEAIKCLVEFGRDDIFVSTTGKTSRELFEVRAHNKQPHHHDFLTVGSMGHSSSIALGIAMQKPKSRIWCIDGDGSTLMHMGAIALVGSKALKNYIHVLINNGAHESVGGQPTVAKDLDFGLIARGCNYKSVYRASNCAELNAILEEIKDEDGPVFLEVKTVPGSRADLGRPTVAPQDNKKAFMDFLKECE
ncbi:MAG: phosphonopyruvate decarboxylase [Dehalococcoidales bacterium]